MDTDLLNQVTTPDPELERQDGITVESGTAALPLDDDELGTWIITKTREHNAYVQNILKLDERRKMNRDFWRGKHYANDEVFDGANGGVAFKDPIIHQNLETRISIAASRLPDAIVTSDNDANQAVEDARDFKRALEKKVKDRVTRRLVKRGLRHMELDYTAAIKFRWDEQLNGGQGDFVRELVRPDRLILDHTATIPDDGFSADNMQFIGEILEEPTGVIFAKFPDKKEDLMALVRKSNKSTEIPSKLKYQETHFTWYDKQGKIFEGIAWSYQNLILGKQKAPYWDWDGYDKVVVNIKEDGSFARNVKVERTYYNYFDRPRKPYILFSYETLGEGPYEATTLVEQAIPVQKQVNKRGVQINKINDNAIPKKVFAGKFITKEQARNVSNDPDEHIWLDGADDASKAFTTSVAQPAHPVLIQDMVSNRNRLDAIFATHGTTRGETIPNGESGLSKQITREGDLSMSDDMVDIVVERVMYETYCWAVQMMKLFYEEDHFVQVIGQDGSNIAVKLHRDNIADGLAIDVEASSVDKQVRRSDALNLASRKAIDPLTMAEDMDMPNPQERTRRLVAWLNGAQDGYQSYMAEISVKLEHTQEQTPDMNTNPVVGEQNADAQQAQTDIESLAAGQPVNPPKAFDATYVQAFLDFEQSGQFDSLPPEAQAKIRDFVDSLKAAASSMEAPAAVAPQLAPGP